MERGTGVLLTGGTRFYQITGDKVVPRRRQSVRQGRRFWTDVTVAWAISRLTLVFRLGQLVATFLVVQLILDR
jgi:hypothetical protein